MEKHNAHRNNGKQTSEQKLPAGVCSKILEAAQGQPLNRQPIEHTTFALTRIGSAWFADENTDRELLQFAEFTKAKYGYLTSDEIEYAFRLTFEGVLEMDYQPKALTFKFLQATLKNYARACYKVKFPPEEVTAYIEPPLKKWERLQCHVLFYRMMPSSSGR